MNFALLKTIGEALAPMKSKVILLGFTSICHTLIGLGLAMVASRHGSHFPLLILFVLLFGSVFSWLEELLIIPIGTQIGAALSARAFANILRQPPTSKVSMDLLSQTQRDAYWIVEWTISLLRTFFKRGIQLVVFSAWLFYLNPLLTLLCIPIFLLVLLPGMALGNILGRVRRELVTREGALSLFENEAILNIVSVRGYGAEDFVEKQQQVRLDRLWTQHAKHRRLNAFINPLTLTILAIGAAVIYWVASSMVTSGTLSSSTIFSFLTGIILLYAPLSGFGRDLLMARSVKHISHLHLLTTSPAPPPSRTPIRDNISCDDITFGYTDQPLVTSFSHTFKKGTVTAVVGRNGCGKSTLLHLILGVCNPTSGRILIDGVPSLPLRVGFVDQKGAIFTESLQMNLHFGRSLKNTSHRFSIDRDPISVATVSGGERRKISMDRALSGSLELLVIDEPEESLDSSSQEIVKRCICDARDSNVIVIIATHDPEYIALANEIITIGDA